MYPSIELNSYYQKMNQDSEAPEVKEYLSTKIRQAEWVKQCVLQRGKTLMQVSRAILEHQEEFFTYGPSRLAPLRLADIAGELGIHESTVSRAVNKKYLQCSWGVYPLSFFFSRSVSRSENGLNSASHGINAAAIKLALRKIIAGEDPQKALQRPPSKRKTGFPGYHHLQENRCKIQGRGRNFRRQRAKRVHLTIFFKYFTKRLDSLQKKG